MSSIELVRLGKHMRAAANDREGLMADLTPTVPVYESWDFVLDNAGQDSKEFFDDYVPLLPPHAFILGYYSAESDVDVIAASVDAYFNSEMSA